MHGASEGCLSEELVLGFYEGRLSEAELARLEAHVDSCDSCRLLVSTVADEYAPSTPQEAGGRRTPASFPDGARIAGRYRVARFIGAGGMGEVYEAEDAELRERVALKTVRAVVADDSRAIERLKREVQLARRVTHANVCRIFDFGVHEAGGVSVPFLTMELLAGGTLSERLRRGPLSTGEALPLAQQMAAALDAAHQVGVVHRDFKSANVLLVGARAVVTDFGLAREAEVPSSLSASGELVGSPEYMAPEQLEGREVTGRSDVYAFAVVLYEMVTGTLPFSAATRIATAIARLHQAPPSPRERVPSLPPSWERAILRGLERKPEARFASAGELVRALASDATLAAPAVPAETATETATAPRARPRLLPIAAVAVAMAAVVAAGAFVVHRRGRATKPAAPAVALRRSLAVVGFRDLDYRVDAKWYSTALAEMLDTDLASGDEVRVAPQNRVADARRDLALDPGARYERATLARLRQQLGVDWVLGGSYLVEGTRLRLDLAVQDTVSGETLAVVSESGAADGLLDLVSRTGARLRQALSLAGHGADPALLQQLLPKRPEVARTYVEALDLARHYDHVKSRDRLLAVVAAEPDFALGHSELAYRYDQLGQNKLAQKEADAAYTLSSGLPRSHRLWLEAVRAQMSGKWQEAADLYRALFTFYPDDLRYGVALARAQVVAGHARDALVTLERLHQLPPPLGNYPVIDFDESYAWGKIGDNGKRLDAALRAATKARAIGSKLLLADADDKLGETYIGMGQPDRGREAYAEAKKLYEETGDQSGVVRVQDGLAELLVEQGKLDEARANYQRSLAYYEAAGNEQDAASELNRIGGTYDQAAKLEPAKRAFAAARDRWHKIEDREGESNAMFNYGQVLLEEADVAGAEAAMLEVKALNEQLGTRDSLGHTLSTLAAVRHLRGRLAEARTASESALAIERELQVASLTFQSLRDLAPIARDQGREDEAAAELNEARGIADKQQATDWIVDTDVALAEVALDRAKTPEAARAVERQALAVADHAPASATGIISGALGIALEAALAASEQPTAIAARLSPLVDKMTPLDGLAARLRLARSDAAAGRCTDARRTSAAVRAEAAKKGIVLYEIEATLAAARIDGACGGKGVALAQTAEKSARAHGFVRLAAAAHALATN
jgi:eukaryotic-like serine/threonine-protein kinase